MDRSCSRSTDDRPLLVVSLTFFLPLALLRLLLSLLLWLLGSRLTLRPLDLRLRRQLLTLGRPLRWLPLLTLDLRGTTLSLASPTHGRR